MSDAREILENVADGVYFVDTERRIIYWNRGATEISGHDSAAVLGKRCPLGPLQHVDAEGRSLCQTDCPLAEAMADGQPRQAEIFLRHKDGHRVPVRVSARPLRSPTGEITGAVETFTDITPLVEARRRSAELERQALVDTLTGLGNRRYAERQLASLVAELDRYARPFGVLFLDIDRFKDINDTWGHATGDATLRMIAKTLTGAARVEDLVYRWGGEEFLILVREADAAGLAAAGERFRRMVQLSTLTAGETRVSVTVSIGGAVARPGVSAEQLIAQSDAQLYESKRLGRNRVTIAS